MPVPYFTPITEINYTNNTTVTIGSFTIGIDKEAFVKKEPAHQINVAAATGATSVRLTGVYF